MLIGFALWYWLNKQLEAGVFSGEDSLLGRETRLAWNLLIPTLTIFVLVAARPLEQTFIRSLTDKRFAGSAVPQFVGLENYLNLLTFRLDTVDCKKSNADAPCDTRANGSIRWDPSTASCCARAIARSSTSNLAIGRSPSAAWTMTSSRRFIRRSSSRLFRSPANS